jgi:16S rRNA (guanine527-N7)-methyltransferase
MTNAGSAAAIGLTAGQARRLDALLALLESDPRAPTTVRERDEAQNVHIADSLAALELDVLSGARQIVDIGSGAGFPGLALAVAMPATNFVLLESQRRKCDFLLRAQGASSAGNVTVVCARVEQWREGLRSNDAVLARAVASQPVVLEYAAPLLRVGGHVVDWRGISDAHAEASADRAAAELGLARTEVRKVKPFPEARNRFLHVFTKIAETPERFPRRVGVAHKRPLGS